MNNQEIDFPKSYINDVYHSFLLAEKNTESFDQYYNIANHIVRMRFAGSAMIPFTTTALNHLKTNIHNMCSLTICVWDSVSTQIDLPFSPWENANNDLKEIKGLYKDSEHVRVYFKGKNIQGIYQIETKVLSLLDTARNIGIFWINDARKIPFYTSSSPFRSIIQWWATYQDLLLVHAGAIGNDQGGVLLVGKSGSGKSCTAMACISSTLQYAGDDHVLINTKSPFFVHSLYNACKLNNSDINRFPDILNVSSNYQYLNSEKAVIFLHGILPNKVTRGFQIRAILLPKIVNFKETRLIEVTPSEALRALAPSTIFQLPGAGNEDLKGMAKLVKQVPNFLLEIGSNSQNIPDLILDLLEKNRE